ncbi:MAG: sensor histidine kinase [Thermoleophilia bacterium]
MTRLGIHRIDLLLVVPLLVVAVAGSFGAARGQDGRRGIDALAIVLLVAGPLLLLLWRRWPLVTLGGVVGVTAVYFAMDYPYGPVFFSLVLALIAGVVSGHRRVAWALAAALLVVVLTIRAAGGIGQDVTSGDVAAGLTWAVIALVLGEVVKLRMERRAARAEAREDEMERRAQQERLRIARELHDVLAHSISLINVQAGVALHVMDERPEQARASLAAIRDASRDALQEVRATLGTLRAAGEGAPRSPAPTLDDLEELAARATAGGVRVTTEVTGARRPLPPGVDRAAFRIVQEAVTNVHRHAGAGTATVHVDYGDWLTVQVDDDGRGAASDADGSGSGIAGMRERAAAAGGSLEAGPRPEGGYRVRARLPLRGAT